MCGLLVKMLLLLTILHYLTAAKQRDKMCPELTCRRAIESLRIPTACLRTTFCVRKLIKKAKATLKEKKVQMDARTSNQQRVKKLTEQIVQISKEKSQLRMQNLRMQNGEQESLKKISELRSLLEVSRRKTKEQEEHLRTQLDRQSVSLTQALERVRQFEQQLAEASSSSDTAADAPCRAMQQDKLKEKKNKEDSEKNEAKRNAASMERLTKTNSKLRDELKTLRKENNLLKRRPNTVDEYKEKFESCEAEYDGFVRASKECAEEVEPSSLNLNICINKRVKNNKTTTKQNQEVKDGTQTDQTSNKVVRNTFKSTKNDSLDDYRDKLEVCEKNINTFSRVNTECKKKIGELNLCLHQKLQLEKTQNVEETKEDIKRRISQQTAQTLNNKLKSKDTLILRMREDLESCLISLRERHSKVVEESLENINRTPSSQRIKQDLKRLSTIYHKCQSKNEQLEEQLESCRATASSNSMEVSKEAKVSNTIGRVVEILRGYKPEDLIHTRKSLDKFNANIYKKLNT